MRSNDDSLPVEDLAPDNSDMSVTAGVQAVSSSPEPAVISNLSTGDGSSMAACDEVVTTSNDSVYECAVIPAAVTASIAQAAAGNASVSHSDGPVADAVVEPADLQPAQQQLAYSTLLSLLIVLVLIITIRFTVPPLVESLRYSWHHGQLRAEYDISGQQLRNVSLSSLSEASELVSRRVGPSVVHINLLEVRSTSKRFFFGDRESVEMVGQGSGIILDKAGHILTNHHVIDGAGRIEVALSDGRRLQARELGRDPFTDLAVIKVEAEGLLPAEWGDSNRVDVGTPVWAVGSPFGLERTVTFGILSGKHRIDLKGSRHWDGRNEKETMYSDLMQSDVAVNPGNSGGPLVNSEGQIVGVNTAIVGETYIGISFAIPSNVARRVAEGLIKEGEVARGWLGLVFKSDVDESGEVIQQRGAMVGQWASGDSPARLAGIKPGDLIIKFGGKDIENFRMLTAMVAQADVGSFVPVELLRDGKTLTLEVEIGRRPELPGDPR